MTEGKWSNNSKHWKRVTVSTIGSTSGSNVEFLSDGYGNIYGRSVKIKGGATT